MLFFQHFNNLLTEDFADYYSFSFFYPISSTNSFYYKIMTNWKNLKFLFDISDDSDFVSI